MDMKGEPTPQELINGDFKLRKNTISNFEDNLVTAVEQTNCAMLINDLDMNLEITAKS